MNKYPPNEIVDAVIIGTGAGGAPLLARLAQAGLKVVALEAGKRWNPEKDFATDEKAQDKLYWNYERLSAGNDPLSFGKNNSGIGLGGSTLHFTGYTPRPLPGNFQMKTISGKGKDWPLSYEDLEPYYDEIEKFIGVSGPNPYPWGPERKSGYPLPPMPMNAAAQLMQKGCEKVGIKTAPGPNAIISKDYKQEENGIRKACNNRGFCQAGCSVGAKGSTDVTYIPLALHHGAEIRTESFAREFTLDDNGHINSVIYFENGVEKTQRCNNVFLCAGAIETPRLLLMNNLANSSGLVGKNFMAHVGTQLWGEFDELTHPYKGVPATLISEDMNIPGSHDFAGGYILQSIGIMPVNYVSQLVRSTGVWGKKLKERMQNYNHVAGINIHGECLPYETNFLELSEEKDELGLPKPRIHFSNGENEKKMSAHGTEIMQKVWKEAGAKNMFVVERNAHIIGTCGMAETSAEGVVNRDGQSFDIPNLYISDNSIFPGSLSANPALTIMALSLRIADQFLKNRLN